MLLCLGAAAAAAVVVDVGWPGAEAAAKMPQSKSRKIVILGSRSVGKSSPTIQFVEGQFVDPYDPTIENTFTKVITVNGQEYHLLLVDTAGQDEYSIIPQMYSIDIKGYILVYSVTSIKSFEFTLSLGCSVSTCHPLDIVLSVVNTAEEPALLESSHLTPHLGDGLVLPRSTVIPSRHRLDGCSIGCLVFPALRQLRIFRDGQAHCLQIV
ncbi:hypothetical protein MC885_012712, partial [Smutsia gigantea]